jgi:hypothetical protein
MAENSGVKITGEYKREFGTYKVEESLNPKHSGICFTVYLLSDCGLEEIGMLTHVGGEWCASSFGLHAGMYDPEIGFLDAKAALNNLLYRTEFLLGKTFKELVEAL